MCYIVCMDSDVREKTDIFAETKIQEPKRYKVIFFNDDYTTKDFVVDVLKKLREEKVNILV